jgi:hypothetical protein
MYYLMETTYNQYLFILKIYENMVNITVLVILEIFKGFLDIKLITISNITFYKEKIVK